jgi:hypothetical protein
MQGSRPPERTSLHTLEWEHSLGIAGVLITRSPSVVPRNLHLYKDFPIRPIVEPPRSWYPLRLSPLAW